MSNSNLSLQGNHDSFIASVFVSLFLIHNAMPPHSRGLNPPTFTRILKFFFIAFTNIQATCINKWHSTLKLRRLFFLSLFPPFFSFHYLSLPNIPLPSARYDQMVETTWMCDFLGYHQSCDPLNDSLDSWWCGKGFCPSDFWIRRSANHMNDFV